MKIESQVINFITSQTIKGKSDWEFIKIFCQNHHFRLGTYSPLYDPQCGISSTQFHNWVYEGYANGDIAQYQDKFVIVGKGGIDKVEICGEFFTDGKFCEASYSVPVAELKQIDPDTQANFNTKLSQQSLEYCRNKYAVVKKYTPKVNERVLIWNQEKSYLGVIRQIDPDSNEVILFCYFDYGTKKCAYSMHETGIVTYHEFHFEPMNIIAQRRLNTELNKHGKTWYDKLHRIEPLNVKVECGQKYWYINDKMKVIQETEKDTPTSQFRYIAGNYFSNLEEAEKYLGLFKELLKDRLAKLK